MTSSGKKKRRSLAEKAALVAPGTATDVTFPAAGTGVEIVRSRSGEWFPSGDVATTARPDDEEGAATGSVGGGWALAEKYVLRGLKRLDVFVLALIGLDVIIIYLDNKQGLLTDATGLRWTILKCTIVDGFLIALAIVIK